jgi:hypothetical protein
VQNVREDSSALRDTHPADLIRRRYSQNNATLSSAVGKCTRRSEGASRAEVVGYAIVKLTVTVRIASKPIGAYFHCLTASIADRANASFVDRRTVMSPIVPSA